ncbi:hypothetical protein [Streptacidiphilus neutrinimicus]|uniref:hypothetical protein n=1 Tax=Streptacidiphilus neutrinimicus TaxID=105420 RepID=UPI000A52130E|nr:hypothetical protein [Streptacidiphilus neutrinimicus]
MNIDFSSSPGFSAYVVLLLVSGIAMLVIAALNSSGQTTGWRIFNAIVGVGFFGYGIYLGFVFTGGSYLILFKVFILPVALIVNFFRSRKSRHADAAAPQAYVPTQGAPQPYDAAAPYVPTQGAPQPYDAAAPYAYAPQAPQQPMPQQTTPYQPTQPQGVQPPVPQAPQG